MHSYSEVSCMACSNLKIEKAQGGHNVSCVHEGLCKLMPIDQLSSASERPYFVRGMNPLMQEAIRMAHEDLKSMGKMK